VVQLISRGRLIVQRFLVEGKTYSPAADYDAILPFCARSRGIFGEFFGNEAHYCVWVVGELCNRWSAENGSRRSSSTDIYQTLISSKIQRLAVSGCAKYFKSSSNRGIGCRGSRNVRNSLSSFQSHSETFLLTP